MTATKSWTINCDGCGLSDESDLAASTAGERRRALAFDHGDGMAWHVNLAGGRDVCGYCWAEGVR